MSIVVECPHCQTRFNLQEDMNGKTMRCPNLECRMGFVVKAKQAAPPPPVYEPPAETKPVPKPGASKPPKPAKPAKPQQDVVDAVVVDAAVVSTPKVKEVVWSEGQDVPPTTKKGRKPAKPEVVEDEPDDLPVRRKKKRNRGPLILAAMGVFIAFAVGGIFLYIGYFQRENEKKLEETAKAHYEKGEWADAAKSYEKLATEYPSSDKIGEYKFFADMSAMQKDVRSVANRENYDAALKRLQDFIKDHKDSPLAKPSSGFGRDILEAGKKLGEDIANHGEDRIKAFQAARATKGGELDRAEKSVTDGRALVEIINPLRAPDDDEAPLNRLRESFTRVENGVKRERERTAAINDADERLKNPTDAIIQTVLGDLQAKGFHEDPEAKDLIAKAKGKLRDLVRYEDDPAEAQPPPPTAAASLLFVTPIGRTKLHEPVAGDPPPTVFLCVSRGILYAFDENDGLLLWAARVGPDVIDPPSVARVQLDSGPTDLAVVASNVGNAPAVSGVALKNGKPQWYQPLPAAAAGPAAIVGTRAFVPVRDALGTVFEFDIATGARIGFIRLGQPVAERGAVIRPGTGFLYIAAEARRVYVLDAGGKDVNGNRVNPRCAQVIATGHLPGTLRVPPLFVGPEGTNPGPALYVGPEGPVDRFIVLAQADGTSRTLLRAFAVTPLPPPAAGETSVPETPTKSLVELPVPGWVSSMPITDSERLALITDTGEFRLFGVNQPENRDKPLFPYPNPKPLKAPGDRIPPGLVIPAGESTYWLLTAGQLQKAQLAMVPNRGQEVVFSGSPTPIGEPVHPAQVNSRRDTVCVVVRSLNSSGCRAVAINLRDGEIRWERQLGLVPAKLSTTGEYAAPIAQGDRFIMVDEGGAIFAVPATDAVGVGQTVTAPDSWMLKPSPEKATEPTVVAASADGKVVFTITPVERERRTFVIRRIVDAKPPRDDEVTAPAAITGQPAVVGGFLHIPTADGFVQRYIPGDGPTRPGSLVAGPKWHDERRIACSITPLSDSAFATSDGGKTLNRWEWPTPNGKFSSSGTLELNQDVAGPGVVLPPAEVGSPPRLMVADKSGTVWLFAADRAAGSLRRWRPGGGSVIPAGKPSSGIAVQTTEMKQSLAYVVEGKSVVGIDPEAQDPLWVTPAIDAAAGLIVGMPQPAGANRWVVTTLAGNILLIDGANGAEIAKPSVGLQGAVPAAASGVAANSVLTPLSDGSAVMIELPRAAEAPKK